MRKVTIHDVAKLAGVSAKTVSRVLNDEPNVRETVRERVRAATAELRFRPNISARRLRGSSSNLIVAFADAPMTLNHLKSEHGSNFLDRFQLGGLSRCRDSGFHLLVELVDLSAPDLERQAIALLSALAPDGVILTPPSCDSAAILNVLETMETPYVRLASHLEPSRGSRVFIDEAAASYEMTAHLIESGHTQIGFIVGSPRYAGSQARLSGFRRAMADAGLAVKEDWIGAGDFTFVSGQDCGAYLLQRPDRPTAVFASSDEMALGVMHVAAAAGLSIPGDLSVVGFDDMISARFSIPPLTTIRQPVAEMSLAAADMLITRSLDKRQDDDPVHLELPFQLVLRGSVAAPSARRSARRSAAGVL
jgi:LacI family transcriptional regulator